MDIVKNDANKRLKTENQPKIYEKFELIKINITKMEMANRAIIKFFTCCNIPFHVVENPFFYQSLPFKSCIANFVMNLKPAVPNIDIRRK